MNAHEKRFLKVIRIVVLSVIFIISCTHRDFTITAKGRKFKVLCETCGNEISTPRKTCLNDEVVRAIALEKKREGYELVIMPDDMVNGWWANSGEKPYGISKDSTSYERQFANWKEATALCYESGIKVYTLRGNNEHGLSAVFPSKLYRHRFYRSEISQSCQP